MNFRHNQNCPPDCLLLSHWEKDKVNSHEYSVIRDIIARIHSNQYHTLASQIVKLQADALLLYNDPTNQKCTLDKIKVLKLERRQLEVQVRKEKAILHRLRLNHERSKKPVLDAHAQWAVQREYRRKSSEGVQLIATKCKLKNQLCHLEEIISKLDTN